MKLSWLFIALISTSGFAAETTLEFPLTGYYFENNKEIKIKVSKLNKELNQANLDGLPETVVVGGDPAPYWKLLLKRIRAGNEKLGREMHFYFYDSDYGEGAIYKLALCYRGKISDVPALIESMNENFLNPDQGILAIAAGKKKVINDKAFKSEKALRSRFGDDYQAVEESAKKWLNYDEKSDVALVMSDYGGNGDGTELEVNEIMPCK